jgi:hypothetical protein
MEDILCSKLTNIRHELIADFQLALSHSKCVAGAGWQRVQGPMGNDSVKTQGDTARALRRPHLVH